MLVAERELPVVMLKPCELYFGVIPALISTIVGSCVSVTMYSPGLRIGAICHALLPERRMAERVNRVLAAHGSGEDEAFKFIDSAIEHMIGRFREIGIEKEDLEVKVFGGSRMIEPRYSGNVGPRNIQKAFGFLSEMGLKVAFSDVGGSLGRAIFFNTYTGDVVIKTIRRSEEVPLRPTGSDEAA